jgi:hypothetical protein
VFLIAPMLVRRAVQQPTVLLAAAGAGFLGVGMAAVYLAPALGLLGLINSGVFTGPYYQPMSWSVFAHVQRGEWDVLMVRPLLVLALVVLIMAAKGERFWRYLTLACAVAALGLAPIWIAPLDRVQFPWRLLTIIEFTAITALATAERRRFLPMAAALVLMGPFVVSEGFHALRAFNGKTPEWRRLIAVRQDAAEYTPKGAPLVQVSPGTQDIDVRPYLAFPPAAEIIEVAQSGRVVLRRFYFPIWRVTGPRGDVPVSPDGPGRLLSFEAEPGVYRLGRAPHPLERLGWWVSALAAIGAVLVGLAGLVGGRGSKRLESLR